MKTTSLFRLPIARLGIGSALAVALAFGTAPPQSAYAAEIVVTTTTDEVSSDDDCSLREAIRAANRDEAVSGCAVGNGSDTITVPAGTYTLTYGKESDGDYDLDISSQLTINGAGSGETVIDGNNHTRVFEVRSGANATFNRVAVSNTQSGGEAGILNNGTLLITSSRVNNHFGSSGIKNTGRLTVRDTTIDGNNWRGAGLHNIGAAELQGVTFRNNYSPFGGGVDNVGTLTIKGGSFADNYGDLAGGAIHNVGTLNIAEGTSFRRNGSEGESEGTGGAIYNVGTMTVADATFEDNEADFGGAISNGSTGKATVSRSTLTNNHAWNGNGGGIWNDGQLTIDQSTIAQNTSTYDSGNGGGIQNEAEGVLTIKGSTVDGNQAGIGGGIVNWGTLQISRSTVSNNKAMVIEYLLSGGDGGGIAVLGGKLSLTNVTISGNRAALSGGGIFNRGSSGYSQTYLNNVTIANNIADDDANGNGNGGGMYNGSYDAGNRIRTKNTIVGKNQDMGGQALDCAGKISSYGYNLVQKTKGCTISNITTGNRLGLDPKLGSLADNGGPTKTHALLSGSPAIDKANPSAPGSTDRACATTDQRGVTRPKDGDGKNGPRCDIGAFERRSSSSTLTGDEAEPLDEIPSFGDEVAPTDQTQPALEEFPTETEAAGE